MRGCEYNMSVGGQTKASALRVYMYVSSVSAVIRFPAGWCGALARTPDRNKLPQVFGAPTTQRIHHERLRWSLAADEHMCVRTRSVRLARRVERRASSCQLVCRLGSQANMLLSFTQ